MEAFLNPVSNLSVELIPNLIHFFLEVATSLCIVVTHHLVDNVADISRKISVD